MALRREDLTAEEQLRQEALDRSWSEAQRSLSDPSFRDYLERSIERVNASPTSEVLTSEGFLTLTEPSPE
ncbi:hypothetical protein BH23ACT2_BH23ACT2_26030 [soil metagenome]